MGDSHVIWCLVHLTHFDSVFGLNTVPESLNEHCSSQKIFEKKIKLIKSNQMRQKFGKKKNFVDKNVLNA